MLQPRGALLWAALWLEESAGAWLMQCRHVGVYPGNWVSGI